MMLVASSQTTSRGKPLTQVAQGAWCDNHHVVESRDNRWAPTSRRDYFDHLPVVRMQQGELVGRVLGNNAKLRDVEDHQAAVTRRIRQFPSFWISRRRKPPHRSSLTQAEKGSSTFDHIAPVSQPPQLPPVYEPKTGHADLLGMAVDAFIRASGPRTAVIEDAVSAFQASRRGSFEELSDEGNESTLAGSKDSCLTDCDEPLLPNEVPGTPGPDESLTHSQSNASVQGSVTFAGSVKSHSSSFARPKRRCSTGDLSSPSAMAALPSMTRRRSMMSPRTSLAARKFTIPMDALTSLDETEEFANFLTWLQRHFANVVRLWRRLDRDGNMLLHKHEFMRGMKQQGYRGNLERLWVLLDRDTTGNISFMEFAPEVAGELTRFKRWTIERFGSIRQLFEVLDVDRNGGICLEEFIGGCRSHGLPTDLQRSVVLLFEALDAETEGRSASGGGNGLLNWEEFQFIDKWKPPAYLWEEPNFEAGNNFREALLRKNRGNELLAWRRCLDRDGSMRVGYEEFCIQCRVLSKRGIPEAGPQTNITSVYVALDQERHGWFTLKDWSEGVNERLIKFLSFSRESYGSCANFVLKAKDIELDFDDEQEEDTAGLSFKKFCMGIKSLKFSYEQKVELFEGLQGNARARPDGLRGLLYPKDVQFLAKWDPWREEKEDALWSIVLSRSSS